jgi:transposase
MDEIGDESIARLSPDEAPPFAETRAVLGALTLCYARQIYHSADAALVVARDLSFPCLCGGELPDAGVLRRFRAENREAIHHCLTAALQFLVEQKISSGVVTKVNVAQVAEEASRRIITAMFADSMERDGKLERADDPSA